MAKKIVVFADGTGNAFSTQESNVWRIFQALDTAREDQIAYYIQGVGTQSFKPFAIVDGATGFGVPSNVRKLYRFLCWNWEAGDEIYMFGFSRGAFTIRTLVGLMHHEGLIPPTFRDPARADETDIVLSHREMQRYARAAYRSYRAKTVRSTLGETWPTVWAARWIRDLWLKLVDALLRRRPYDAIREQTISQGRVDVPIAFVGLFDTVEAFGVPIEELRLAIDKAVWPISFRNGKMSRNVQRVRHALSLDDERMTFHPIRIDRSEEDQTKDRVREVWFAGVHSDVGGGYPDDSLAHAPLVWMLDEVERAARKTHPTQGDAGLRLLAGETEKFRAAASAYGPLHDSRAGLGVFYRYDPRRIADDGEHGATVHHSVIERMVNGSDNYAPITLPRRAEILMPDETYMAKDGFPPESLVVKARIPSAFIRSVAEKSAVARDAVAKLCKPEPEYASLTLDLVWWRRVNYFALVGSIFFFAIFPFAADWLSDAIAGAARPLDERLWDAVVAKPTSGVENVFRGFGDALQSIAPSYVRPHIEALGHHPLIGFPLLALIGALLLSNARLRDSIRDHARLAWRFEGRKIDEQLAAESRRRGFLSLVARRMRRGRAARAIYGFFSVRILPPVTLLLVLLPSIGALNRVFFNYQVGAGDICIGTNDPRKMPATKPLQWIGPYGAVRKKGWSADDQSDGFATSNPCWASGWAVEKGAAYRVSIEIDAESGHDEPWFDQLIMTDVAGFESDSLSLGVSTLFRRWPSIGWFHPVARIGATGDAEWPLISIDGAQPLQTRGEKCTQLPIRYGSEEYCKLNKIEPRACPTDDLALSMADQLPEKKLAAARAAWSNRRFSSNSRPCLSAFPRQKLVSDFVATKTGEFFLFVNDAVFFPVGGSPQPTYLNNRGTATVTLERLPLPSPDAGASPR